MLCRFGRAASKLGRVSFRPKAWSVARPALVCSRPLQVSAIKSREDCLAHLRKTCGHQPEFLQAVDEVIESLKPLFDKHPEYLSVLPVVSVPERLIKFRVTWVDDAGKTHVNRALRCQFNSAIGPYKGGLRFHPSVNDSIIKFLGFEQIFKNALTGLPMGGGKGGCDFDPKGKSESEVFHFCQAFMSELSKHIGPHTDVPAGDIGVGGREVGYMFGKYKHARGEVTGTLTGKGPEFGGSRIRPEATGYGLIYFAMNCFEDAGMTMEGKKCLISGSGNVAEYCAEKVLELGGKVMTFSDSGGSIVEPEGFSLEQVNILRDIKAKRGRVSEYTKHSATAKYYEGKRPWGLLQNADYAWPCATQNEIEIEDAKDLVKAGVVAVGEGANMPSTSPAIEHMVDNGILFMPAKAANAGGVAVSGLEMTQNRMGLAWSREEVDAKLKQIMRHIYDECTTTAEWLGKPGDLQLGANAAGFMKVAEAMFNQGDLLRPVASADAKKI